MANDITPYQNEGDIQSYAPSQPLAPAPDITLTNREIDDYQQYSGGGQMIFGQPLPAGVTISQVMQGYQQLGNVFVSDFMQLGHNVSQTQKAVKWFMAAITSPPQQQRPHHRYNLFEHSKDPLFQAFGNFAHDNGFSAKMVSDCCWWVSEASRRLAQSQPEGSREAHGSAPNQNVEAFYASLSSAEYKHLVEVNNNAWCRTVQVLQDRWGDYTFQINMQVATDYLNSLPVHEQRQFNVMTKGGIELANTVEFWTHMFDAATGAHNLPKDGAGIAREIAECERCMKTNRKRWQADNALQARYRTLLQMRG